MGPTEDSRMDPQDGQALVEAMRRAVVEWREAALREDPYLYDNLRGGRPGPPEALMQPVLRAGQVTLEPLLSLLSEADGDVAFLSVRAVAHFGTAAVAPLLNLLLHEPQSRAWTSMALRMIGAPAVEPLLLELEIAYTHEDSPLRYWLLDAILHITDPRIVAPLLRLLPQLDVNSRRDVIDTLRVINDPSTIPALRVGLSHETSAEVKTAIVRALGWMAGVGSIDIMISALNDPSGAVRQEAIVHLGRLVNARAIPALMRLLCGERDWQAASSALNAMAAHALTPLAEALSLPEPRARHHAARALLGLTISPDVARRLVGDARRRLIEGMRAAQEDQDKTVASAATKVLKALHEDVN